MQPKTPSCLEVVSSSKIVTKKFTVSVTVDEISANTLAKSLDLTEEDVGKILQIENSDILLIEQSTVDLNYEEIITTSTENMSKEQRNEMEHNYNIGIIQPLTNKDNNSLLPIIIVTGIWVGTQLWDIIKGLIVNYTYEKYKQKNDVSINVKIAQFYRDSNYLKIIEYNGKIEDIDYVYEKMNETFLKSDIRDSRNVK